MAERFYQHSPRDGREESLKKAAMAVDDMLMQLQIAKNDTTPRGRGRSQGRGRGGISRGMSPRMDHQQGRGSCDWRVSPGPGFQYETGRYNRARSPDTGAWQARREYGNPNTGYGGRGRSPNTDFQQQEMHRQQERSNACSGRGRNPRFRGRGKKRGSLSDLREFEPPTQQYGGHLDQPQYGQNRTSERLTPHVLVECLAAYPPTFSISLLQLMEDRNMQPRVVREIALSNNRIFCLNGEVLELRPQISLCRAHAGSQGCQNRNSCDNLHICPNYVLNWCRDNNDCVLGHKWRTDHNTEILRSMFLERIPFPALRKLVQSVSETDSGNVRQLDVCRDYNKGSCNDTDCSNLHVCLSFITGLTKCSRHNCKLNHDLMRPDCCSLLETHGVSTNESPRDIVMTLLTSNPSLEQEQDTVKTSKKKQHIRHVKDQKAKKSFGGTKLKRKTKKRNTSSGSGSSSSRSEDDSECSDDEDQSSREKSDSSCDSEKDSGKANKKFSKRSTNVKDDRQRKTPHRSSKEKSKRDKLTNSGTESDTSSQEESDSGSELSPATDDSDSGKCTKRKSSKYGRKSTDKKVTASESSGQNVNTTQDNTAGKQTVAGSSSQTNPVKPEIRRTVWSHYLQGDVPIPEICYYSVDSMCKFEGSGCQRLHSTFHFHWQVREKGNRWMNLQLGQVTCLERSFCDPAEEGVDLPRLDPSTLERSASGLLILMGRDTWHADFKVMTLTNSLKSKTLEIRRLCTEAVTTDIIKPATFLWYFLDKNKKWVQYGKVDTTGAAKLISSATSDDLEKHFKQTPTVPMSFKNSQFIYTLDFTTMTQTNQKTQMKREVRRRPEPHLPEEKSKDSKDQKTSSDLPSYWEVMQPEERMRLVALAPSTSEYQTVVGLLGGKVSSSNVLKVERVQNPFLWRALQNKIKELTVLYGDASKVDVRQLFHGTGHDVMASICSENFDWRLHGSSSGQLYGRGTYFSTDSNYSYKYCRADASGMKYMFVAQTAVGSMILGNSSLVRPPINPATNLPFDSTVNNVTNPTIIVKYDKQEYYPEYILTLS